MATTKNTADLLAQAASTLPDNTTQQISPKDHREMDENIAQSSYNKITDSGLVGLKEYSILPTYESGQGCIVSGKVYISNKITGPGAFASGDWDLYDELTAAEKTKLGYLTVTAGADLDQMQTDIAALDGARINKGTFDQALGVFPGGGTAQDGWTWIAVGVSTTIDGLEINPNDAIVAIVDNASTATASDWHLQDNTDKVISVNGSAGVVVLTKTDIGLSNVPNTDFTTAVGLNTAKVSADGSINTHSDVDTTTSTPSIGEALIWDGSNWVPDTAGGDNIYTADGTLTAARNINSAGYALSFSNLGTNGSLNLGTNVNPWTANSKIYSEHSISSYAAHTLKNTNAAGYARMEVFNDLNHNIELSIIGSTNATNGFMTGHALLQSQSSEGMVFNHTNGTSSKEGSYFFTGAKTTGTAPTAAEVIFNIQNNAAYFGGGSSLGTARLSVKSTSGIDNFICIDNVGNHIFKANNNGDVGIGINGSIGARLRVKSPGLTSGTSPLYIETGNGVMFWVRDDDAIGLYGKTPVVQATTAIAPAIQTPGVGTSVKTDELYDGYTIQQVVKALRNIGILA